MIDIFDLSYGYDKEHPLCEHISLSIEKGDIVSIVGDNGSGKTTLLKVIAGYIPALNGTIDYHINPPTIAFIPANLDYFLLPWYKVYQNISFFQTKGRKLGEVGGFSIAEIRKYLPSARDHFGDSFVYSLSSGEKAVLAFTCAIHSSPDLIILDEIFSNTTRAVSHKMIDIMKNEISVPIIFTSHTKEFVDVLSNKTIQVSC